ncbi:hybrid sensor histidine kinase/response regulator [Pseudomonas indica]|uniref:hybrid sensor histidine kinase/response regulator n=1 Tax=Pseudomonas indica TaxID=137658 RepID=UPI000BABC314|nr:response regulator [Pseudomonas indica]PAU54602.1 hybrid sensor histidine kinase/response regulator [Pseudomonas indica]
MPLDREALRQRLLASFRVEAEERLGVLAAGLANWREASATAESIESLFREVHSLKGAARAAGLGAIERLCHAWESLLSAARHGQLTLTPERVELCRYALHAVQGLQAGQELDEDDQTQLIESLEAAAEGEAVVLPENAPPVQSTAMPADPATVRVSAPRLDALLFQSETLLQHKLEAQAHARALKALADSFQPQRARQLLGQETLKPLRAGLDELAPSLRDALKNLLDYVDWSLAQLDRQHFEAVRLVKAGQHLALGLAQLSENLREGLEDVLLLSGRSLLESLPAMAQDLAVQAGKRLELHMRGETLQIDKRILDELRPVVTHLLRNAVDHGIEPPDVRTAQGKPAVGRIEIELLQEAADRFELRIRDDGQGIDVERLKKRAVELGLMSDEQAAELSTGEAQALVFASGLSSSTIITDLSGRGLGMAIVEQAVERIGGHVETESRPGQGTCFRLHLPISLSIFRAVIVRVAERVFAVPALAVERCLRLPDTAMKRLENRPSLVVGEQVLPVWTLAEVLGLEPTPINGSELLALLLKVRGDRFTLLIDELLGDQEISVKNLGRQLIRVPNLLGATVLGDGRLVPILHPQDLYQSALGTTSSGPALASREAAEKKVQRLLIAEDSFTSRGLLKTILEAAGYQVATANDGLEAWNALKQGQFDLLVSDVEMPRMDGFSLTARIRADRELSELPVVLVTALHSAEDRARGLEAGANAYLVKSGFEQETLLDAIRRLI